MYLFDWLFGRKEHVHSGDAAVSREPEAPLAEVAETVAPGTAIRFHADLVAKLTQDHQQLLKLFTQTQAAARTATLAAPTSVDALTARLLAAQTRGTLAQRVREVVLENQAKAATPIA